MNNGEGKPAGRVVVMWRLVFLSKISNSAMVPEYECAMRPAAPLKFG